MTIDPDFASPAQWARLYRARGVQVVPAFMPGENKSWKRPLLQSWTEFQEALVPDEVFNSWYGPGGQYVARCNMGVICGRCSDNLFVVDLDIHKNPAAAAWWQGLLVVHNNAMELETVEQRTGGGGLQKLFRAPRQWIAPTNKTAIGVDIRGQGGFAMMTPSMHESGHAYEWMEGCSPDEIEIAFAPDWLLEEVLAVVRTHGGVGAGHSGTNAAGIKAERQAGAFDAFGRQTDGREEYMRDLIWAAVVDWRRERADFPDDQQQRLRAAEKYVIYEDHVSPRITDPARSKMELLEQEGRGPTLFWVKWQYAMRQWETDVAEEAAKARPKDGLKGSGYTDYGDEFAAKPKIDPDTGQPLPLILTAEQFLKGYKPPDYLVDCMLQKGYLVSLTARTGHGKTAIAMLLGVCVARGVAFHGKPVEQGGVLFLAGENPDDIRGRYLALAEHEGFDACSIPFHFVDGVIDIRTSMDKIREEAGRVPILSLVIVDTQAAYFLGDEGNSNEQQKWFARLLRELIKLPGKPLVLVNCHPVKNAGQDNLVPMGGSAFLNEVDANLTLWADDRTCTLGPHLDKWRGVTFESIAFELRTVVCDALKDSKGRSMPSVIAVPITEQGAERRATVSDENEKTVLRILHAAKGISIATIARNAGWLLSNGEPAKTKVVRVVTRLLDSKFVYKFSRTEFRLTKKGCKRIGVKHTSEYDEED